MSQISQATRHLAPPRVMPRSGLAEAITKTASTQTYYTIRFLVDRPLVPYAYRAYAYFRWVDDKLDADTGSAAERIAFLRRQQTLLGTCYRGEVPPNVCAEERFLLELIQYDTEKNSGLQAYLRNMMAVMAFDVGRRGRVISEIELSEYTRLLAIAVTEALHYFIGHDCPTPPGMSRYLAVKGAHIIHMLRDVVEDTAAGYFNFPAESLDPQSTILSSLDYQAVRAWVQRRVLLACFYFATGRKYISQVKNPRCRLAGYAYIARFEWMALVIARDGYRIRAEYPERKSIQAGLWMAWRTLLSTIGVCIPMAIPETLLKL